MLERKRAPRRRDGLELSGPFGAVRKNIQRNLFTVRRHLGFLLCGKFFLNLFPCTRQEQQNTKTQKLIFSDPEEPFVGIWDLWELYGDSMGNSSCIE